MYKDVHTLQVTDLPFQICDMSAEAPALLPYLKKGIEDSHPPPPSNHCPLQRRDLRDPMVVEEGREIYCHVGTCYSNGVVYSKP